MPSTVSPLAKRGFFDFHDLRHRAAGQRLVDLEGGRVGVELRHARPHVRVEREIARARQHLAVGERRQLRRLGAEAVGRDVAGGTLGEHDLGDVGHGLFLCEVGLLVALQIEQRGEVAMVDAGVDRAATAGLAR